MGTSTRRVCNADGLDARTEPCLAPTNASPRCGTDNACGFTCNPDFGDCNAVAADGCEVPLSTDARHCGACGAACASGMFCASGRCTATPTTPAPSLAVAKIDHATARLADGRVLIAGGYTGTYQAATEFYDPATNRWTAGPPLPASLSSAAAVRGGDGRVYLFGGYFAGPGVEGRSLDTTYAYDPSSNAWRTLARMPSSRTGIYAALAQDGRIFVMGGESISPGSATTTLNTVDVYDPALGVWGSAMPMVEARAYGCAATAPDGRIFVFGGTTRRGGEMHLSSAEVYDPAANRWATVVRMPIASAPRCVLASDGQMHLVGGTAGTMPISQHYAFAPAVGTYRMLAALPLARSGFGLAEAPMGTILAIGGTIPAGRTATVASYALATDTWR